MPLDAILGIKNENNTVRGVQLGTDIYAKRVSGVQLSMISYAKRVSGVQLSAVNGAGEVRGVQLGVSNGVGVSNVAKGASYGVQLGVVNVSLEIFVGLQCGPICLAGEGRYLQLGLVTIRTTGPWYTRLTPGVGFHRNTKK